MTMALASPTIRADDFAAVVHRYAGPVHAAARRQLGDAHLAEDATQAVFLALHRAGDVPDDRLAGWLFTATRNVCRNLNRSRVRRDKHERRLKPPTAPRDERLDHLDDAIARLGAADRRLIVDRYFAERSTGELAASLGVSEPAVRKRLSRALNVLRLKLDLACGWIPRYAKPEAEGGALSAALLAALPGTAADAAVAPTVLASVANATPAAASAAAALAAGSAKLGAWLIAAAVALVIAGTIGVVVVSTRNAPGVAATTAPAVASPSPDRVALGAPMTPPPLEPAESLAQAGDFSGALAAYVRFLAETDPSAYRDKKDFAWLVPIAGAEKRAELRLAATQLLDDGNRDRDLVDWRVERLLAKLAELDGDAAERQAALKRAIAAYPSVDYAEPSKHSSLQHLYNEVAELIAATDGEAAARAYVLDAFARDDRFAYFFAMPWEGRADFETLAASVGEIYRAKAAVDPRHRERYDRYAAELGQQVKRRADRVR